MEDDNQLVPQLVGKTWMWLPAEPRTPSTRTPSSGSSTPKSEPLRRILIVGAGIAGIASALAISQELGPYVPDLQIIVYERNDVLSTSGGAINLTPVAQRHLDRLGVLDELDRHGSAGGADVDCIELFSSRTGRSLGSIDFTDRHGNGVGGYKGRRVMRIVLSLAMLAVAERTKNIHIEFGKKLVYGEDLDDGGKLHFEDGTTAEGDLVLGCDGVHSATRTRWVAPEYHSQYTGISFLQSIVDTDALQSKVHFNATAMNISRHGSLLTSYCDRDRDQIFLAAIVQFDEQLLSDYRLDNGQDWRTRSAIKRALAEEMRHRFGKSALPCIRELACTHADWILYPVYQVPPGGKWHTDRAILLGDAAHAVCLYSPSTLPVYSISRSKLTNTDAPARRVRRLRPRRRHPLFPHARPPPIRAPTRHLPGVRVPPTRHRAERIQGVPTHVGQEPRHGHAGGPTEGVDAAVPSAALAGRAPGRVGV